jgi:hypothetical protein
MRESVHEENDVVVDLVSVERTFPMPKLFLLLLLMISSSLSIILLWLTSVDNAQVKDQQAVVCVSQEGIIIL